MQARVIVVVSAIAVISLALGISIESAMSPAKTTTLAQTVTKTENGNLTESSVFSSNSNFTTQYIFCAGVPVCGITSATLFTDPTTTVIVFVYPGNYTLTLSHQIDSSTTNSTVTELIVIIPIEGVDAFVCGTTTALAGTVLELGNTTTTEYILSTAISGTSQRFPNENSTTVTSTSVEGTSTFTAHLVTFTSTSQGTTVCNFPP